MLYDPKWKKSGLKSISDLTFSDFVLWLETQDPNKKYDWLSICGCAVGQFVTDLTGIKNPAAHVLYHQLFGGWDYRRIAGQMPYTFGAVLERAQSNQ